MAWYRINENILNAIANAIIAKTGNTAPMTPVEMVSKIQSIQTGEAYELHSIQITLASSTLMISILNTYIEECSSWRIYPTEAENTELNTIAQGMAFINNAGTNMSPPIMPVAVSATGVSVPSNISNFNVNDATYNSVRQRANVASKPAGSYQLDFYGVAL